jgi:hypothetical protein
MSLSITFRPQKDIYSSYPITAYSESYYNSRWVSGHLPIQYKIRNTKWPTNSDDDVDNICAVSDNNGFAEINLCGTYETYVKFEYIKIEDSTIESYNGVWQILDKVNATTLVISAAYNGTATGTAQRYYNNYFNLVKVYAGIPSYHQYDSEDPMSLIATLKVYPNTSNIAVADISGLIQAKLNCDNDREQISEPNDLNAWTGFYISYAESYDQSDGTEVTTYTSSYTTDTNTDCTASNLIENGNFPSNINGWVNGSTGSSFVYDSGGASATKGANSNSTYFYQEVPIIANTPYNVLASVTNNESNSLFFTILFFPDPSLPIFGARLIYAGNITGTQSININVTPSASYGVIAYRVGSFGGSSSQKCTIDNLSVTAADCTYYGFAINGTRQFQSILGGNFGDYVQNYNNEEYLNKFLTHFSQPKWYNSLYFDLSTIIPRSTFSQTVDNSLYYSVNEYTEGGGFIQRQDIELESKDDGVYRLPISDLTLNASTSYFTIQLYQLPTNKLTQGNDGTFDYTNNFLGNPPSDWSLVRASISALMEPSIISRTGANSMANTIGGSFSAGETELWRTSGGITVQQNSDYIIEGYIRNNGLSFNGDEMYIRPYGVFSFEVITAYTISGDTTTWNYFKVVFNTGANSSVNVQAVINKSSADSGGGQIFWDDVTVKGPIENLSEVKTINVDNSCTKQNIYLTWLNNLGAWEYWNFKAEKDYSIEIDDSRQITRDIFTNWDTDFINGETQKDYIGIEAFNRTVVRSQYMTASELEAVKQIKYSIRVQQIRDDDTKVTVLVDKKSFKVKSDGDKLYQIEFEISYPSIQIQTQ